MAAADRAALIAAIASRTASASTIALLPTMTDEQLRDDVTAWLEGEAYYAEMGFVTVVAPVNG